MNLRIGIWKNACTLLIELLIEIGLFVVMRRIEKTQWDRDVDRHGSMTRQVEYEL